MRAIENAIENIDDMLDAIVNTMLWLAYFVMISPFLVIGGTVYQKANGIPSLGKLIPTALVVDRFGPLSGSD